jgi:heme a synthase
MSETNSQRSVAIWLFVCCAAIFGMVVLGGVTRLTGSGLSMVKWEPIIGALPPMSQLEWEQVFQLYQKYPEYQLKNSGMDLEGFKGIFWFEYAHRLLGRSIGMIFLIPMIYFWIRKKIDRKLAPKLVAMFVLGGLQGLLGWYMVKSGLISAPHVSQYRLTAHLGLAFVIYAYIFWVAVGLLFPEDAPKGQGGGAGLRKFSYIISGLLFVTVLSGGFVAGLKAGLAYNTFPLMGGRWVPEGFLSLEPVWRNFFEDVTTVQFDHRVLATLMFILIAAFWVVARKAELLPRVRVALHLFLLFLFIQVTLGISTLLLYVPTDLAATHQGGALALFTVSLFLSQQLGRQRI